MCSSSTRDTDQEWRILNSFQRAFAHLYFCDRNRDADDLMANFAVILDCDVRHLVGTIRQNMKWWYELGDYVQKKKESDNVWMAGNYMASVGACLFAFGRSDEAAMICETAERFHKLAYATQRQEEEAEASAKAQGEEDEVVYLGSRNSRKRN